MTITTPDLMAPELIADPYGGYGRIREAAPVLRGRFMDGSPAWYVTRYADVRAVLGDPGSSTTRRRSARTTRAPTPLPRWVCPPTS